MTNFQNNNRKVYKVGSLCGLKTLVDLKTTGLHY